MLSEDIIAGNALEQFSEVFHCVSWGQEPKSTKKILFNFCGKSTVNDEEFVFSGVGIKIGLWSVHSLGENVSALGENLLSIASANILCELFSFLLKVFSLILVFIEHNWIPSFLM